MDVIEPELSRLEDAINMMAAIHPKLEVNDEEAPVSSLNTHVTVCPQCSKHMLTCALAIHTHEAHPTRDIVTMKKDEGNANK